MKKEKERKILRKPSFLSPKIVSCIKKAAVVCLAVELVKP
jgi:hypothetical protein